jgi:hypothetical protein
MSRHQPTMPSLRFEPVLTATSPAPGLGTVFFGVIYPATVIAIELATRICAEALFDPMPTYWHTLAISLVPAGNLLLWARLRDPAPMALASLAFTNGAVSAIAGLYALLFLPLLPIAILAAAIGIGLLPLAPLVSFVCAIKLQAGFRRKYAKNITKWPWLGGVAAALLLLLALDIPAAATRLGVQWAASSVPSERQRGLRLLRVLGTTTCYSASVTTPSAGPPGFSAPSCCLAAMPSSSLGSASLPAHPRKRVRFTIGCTACRSMPSPIPLRKAGGHASPTCSSTTIMVLRRLAGA